MVHKSARFRAVKSLKTESLSNPMISALKRPPMGSISTFQPTPQSQFMYSENNMESEERVLVHPDLRRQDTMNILSQEEHITFGDINNFGNDIISYGFEFNFGEQPQLNFEPQIEIPEVVKDDFINPTEQIPMSAVEFMKFVDLSPLEPIIEKMYSDNERAKNAFRFPILAGLKSLIYGKLKKYQFLTNVHQDLLTVEGLPEALGYNHELPSYRQLHKFANEVMGVDGIKKLFDEMVRINLKEGLKHDLNIGEDIMLDACPIRACPQDLKTGDAQINGHYYQSMKIPQCYLWFNFRCLNTRLPLVFHMNHGNDDESKFFLPMLMKAKWLGAPLKKAYIDGGFTSRENIASAKIHYNVDIISNISERWNYKPKATPEEINNRYQRLWKTPIYVANTDDEYKEMALIMTDCGVRTKRLHKIVGDMYRNELICKYEECPDGYLDDYHQRNEVESTHGTEKRIGSVKRTEVRGLKNNTIQLGLHLLMLHLVANTRLRHGVTEGLTDIGYIR